MMMRHETPHRRLDTLHTCVHTDDAAIHAEGACEARAFKVFDAPCRALRELRRRIKSIVGVVEVQGGGDQTRRLAPLRLQRLQRAKPGLLACSLCAARVSNVSRLLLVRCQLAARFEVRSLRIHHRPNNLKHSGCQCQHKLLKLDQALFIVDVVDQERAPNERDQFRGRAAPGKARHVRLLHTTEGEATEVVQPEGESHDV